MFLLQLMPALSLYLPCPCCVSCRCRGHCWHCLACGPQGLPGLPRVRRCKVRFEELEVCRIATFESGIEKSSRRAGRFETQNRWRDFGDKICCKAKGAEEKLEKLQKRRRCEGSRLRPSYRACTASSGVCYCYQNLKAKALGHKTPVVVGSTEISLSGNLL